MHSPSKKLAIAKRIKIKYLITITYIVFVIIGITNNVNIDRIVFAFNSSVSQSPNCGSLPPRRWCRKFPAFIASSVILTPFKWI